MLQQKEKKKLNVEEQYRESTAKPYAQKKKKEQNHDKQCSPKRFMYGSDVKKIKGRKKIKRKVARNG